MLCLFLSFFKQDFDFIDALVLNHDASLLHKLKAFQFFAKKRYQKNCRIVNGPAY